jgi:hypothetical protein
MPMSAALWILFGIIVAAILFNVAFWGILLIILTDMISTSGSHYSRPEYNFFSFETEYKELQDAFHEAARERGEKSRSGTVKLSPEKTIEIDHRIRDLQKKWLHLDKKERIQADRLWHDMVNDAMATGVDPGIFNAPPD